MICPKFLVRRRGGVSCTHHSTERAANEEAQDLANEADGCVGLYELTKEFKPQPEPVMCDIDELIEDRAKGFATYGSAGHAISYSVLQQLKKQGVTTLEMPPGFKL